MKLSFLIKKIISENSIEDQNEIVDILKRDYNKDVKQSSISRMLGILKAIKVVENGKRIYKIQEELKNISSWIKNLVKKIDDNGYMIIVISYTGSGNIIGQIIDERKIDNVMGTVSGDNTTLIIPKDVSEIKKLREDIEKILQ